MHASHSSVMSANLSPTGAGYVGREINWSAVLALTVNFGVWIVVATALFA
jgi:hypothetical protein